MKKIINTAQAPAAIGTYSQAVQVGNTLYLSGQIPIDPQTGEMNNADVKSEIEQIFANIRAVLQAAGGDFDNLVKINAYLLDLGDFALLNSMMAEFLNEPYPARAAIGVAQLPRGARVEVEAVAVL